VSASPLKVTGRVTLEPVDQGSKSEREAVVLRTAGGRSYVLRRQGGPAFGDANLQKLVGLSITASGIEVGRTLVMRDWSPG